MFLEKEMATHSSILAWRIPGIEELGRLPSMGSHRVGHDRSYAAAAAAAAAAHWHIIHPYTRQVTFFFFNFYFYFILLYNTVLVLAYVDMNPPRVYMSSQT